MVRRIALIAVLGLATIRFSILHTQVLSSKDLDTARVYTSLVKAMENPSVVLRLDLSKQRLGSFPEELFSLTNLQELRLNKCRLSELPNRFHELPNLQRIQCQHNELDTIPSSIMSLINLKTLDLSDNFIEIIPSGLPKCKIVMSPPCACMDGEE